MTITTWRDEWAGPAYGAGARACNLARTIAFAVAASLAAASAAAEPVTIAALGDSLTQGYGLPEAEGFVPQLQGWLRENGAPEAVVLNAGVSGDTSAGGLARIDWTLSEEVDAVIVALGGNDLLRGIEPAATRDNLDGILTAIDARGLPALLAGLPSPANYGAEYQAEFEAIFADLADQHGAVFVPSFLAGITEDRDMAAARALMQPDGIHPDAEGVAAIVAAIGPAVLELIERAGAD
jgi:acyl-CoA thioesterase I